MVIFCAPVLCTDGIYFCGGDGLGQARSPSPLMTSGLCQQILHVSRFSHYGGKLPDRGNLQDKVVYCGSQCVKEGKGGLKL